jgi:plasmid stabilization system protein ParE
VTGKPVVALAIVSEDVQNAYDYFFDRLQDGGDRFLDRYFETTDRIAANPWSYPVKFDDYHRALIPRSDFAIYYFQEKARSVIVAVIHARRNPRLILNLVRARR